MLKDPLIVFVCEHGAAKSILAATYFNKFAREKNLRFHAIARGIHPDDEISSKTITGLGEDGLTPNESVPQKLLLEEIEDAQRIISFCELPKEYLNEAICENWHDIPPVSENYEKARAMIIAKLKAMMK